MSLTVLGMIAVLLVSPVALDDEASCTKCEREMKAEWNFCPFDGTTLRVECPKCMEVFSPSWRFCPKDATPLGKAGDGAPEDDAEERVTSNTPGQVRDDFLRALQTQDRPLLDSLMAWDGFHENYLDRKDDDKTKVSLDDFKKQRRAELLSDEVAERVSKMVLSPNQAGGIRVIGKVAELPLNLVNPKDPKDKLTQNLRIEEIKKRWSITDIQ